MRKNTEIPENIFVKARKILALVNHGIGGEKEAARARLGELMRKYNLSPEDFANTAKVETRYFYYRATKQFHLFCQVVASVLGSNSSEFNSIRRQAGKGKKAIVIDLTEVDYQTIKAMFEYYLRAYTSEQRKMVKSFFIAFISKYHLGDKDYDPNSTKSKPMTTEEFARLMSIMGGLGDNQYLKQLS